MNRRSIGSYNEEFDVYGYEPIPKLDTNVTQLIINWRNDTEETAWDWYGTVKDLMFPGGTIEDCVRFVVCFDS
jgi:hypothetical protein